MTAQAASTTKRARTALLAVAVLAGLTACGENPPTTTGGSSGGATAESAGPGGTVEFRKAEPGSGDGLKLGFIALGDSQVPFSKLVTDSMKAQAEAAGADLVVCDSGLDGAKALACAQSFKTQGVQAYLNFQVDAKVSSAICAQGPQVPVIAVDIEQQPCQSSFMGADNEEAGYLGGKAMGDYMKSEFDCAYDAYISVEQPAAGAVNEARMGGYRRGFTEVCGALKGEKVLDGGGALDSARTKFTDTLTSLPDAKRIVVVAINDDSILGALAAAKTAGRQDSLYMSGQGGDPSSWCEIATNPSWVADTAYFPERYGEIGIPYLIDAAKGKALPEKLLVTHEILTADNIEEFYPDAKASC